MSASTVRSALSVGFFGGPDGNADRTLGHISTWIACLAAGLMLFIIIIGHRLLPHQQRSEEGEEEMMMMI